MNARRKKSGARAVPARKAASARQPSVRPSARPAARKPAVSAAGAAQRAPAKTAAKAAAKSKSTTRQPAATVLGADCTIEHAPALHEQLAKVIAERACVTLDFSAVQRCDTAGLQLLASFLRERREAGLAVQLTGTSDNFMTTAGVLGLAAIFGAQAGAAEAGNA